MAPDTLEVVSFGAGGYRFAVEASQVKTQLPVRHEAEIAAVEQLLGLPGGASPGSRRTLLMKHPAGDYAVTVADPVELLTVRAEAIHPLPPLIAARNTLTGLRGLALVAEGVMLLVDFRA